MHLVKFALLLITAYSVTLLMARAQSTSAARLSGRVVGAGQQPLAFVSVGIPGTSVGTVADETGGFALYLNADTPPTDSVRFSLLGYRPLTLTVTDLRHRLSTGQPLALDEQAQQLTEVRVRATDHRLLGSERTTTGMSTNLMISSLPGQNLGSEVGRRFNIPRGQHQLTAYRAYVKTNFDSVTFRVNIYAARTLRPLLTRNVYVTVAPKPSGWVEVDLTPYSVVANADVVVSLQWVASRGNGTYLVLPIQMPTFATHLYKYGSQNRWKTFRGMGTAMNLSVAKVAAAEPATNATSLTLAH